MKHKIRKFLIHAQARVPLLLPVAMAGRIHSHDTDTIAKATMKGMLHDKSHTFI